MLALDHSRYLIDDECLVNGFWNANDRSCNFIDKRIQERTYNIINFLNH